MKRFTLLVLLLTFLTAFGDETKVTVTGSSTSPQEVIAYTGPKARIAVDRFEVKAAKASGEIGEGISDMLVDSLFKTGKFIVLEKSGALKGVQEEYKMGEQGWSSAAPERGTFETADIIITGAITAFEGNYEGWGGGALVIPVPIFGGIALKKDEAYIAANLRLVDVRTRRIINSIKVEGRSSNFKIGGAAGGSIGSVILAGALASYKNTPMEKAVMVMLDNAVNEISKGVPENYYRYGTDGKPTSVVRTQSESGHEDEIIGGDSVFIPGKKVVFEGTFSSDEIGDVPSGWDVKDGAMEVAMYREKKWLRFLEPATVSRKIVFPDEYSFTCDYYLSGDKPSIAFSFDGMEISLDGYSGVLKFGPKEIAKDIKKGVPHAFGLEKKKKYVRIWLDGLYRGKIVTETAPKKSSNQILEISAQANPPEKQNVLITGVRVAGYQ